MGSRDVGEISSTTCDIGMDEDAMVSSLQNEDSKLCIVRP